MKAEVAPPAMTGQSHDAESENRVREDAKRAGGPTRFFHSAHPPLRNLDSTPSMLSDFDPGTAHKHDGRK